MTGVVIRGRHFSDDQAAAARYGVKAETVRTARRDGRLDAVGKVRGPVPRPLTVRGKRFVSARAAADHFGVSDSAVRQWAALEAAGLEIRSPSMKANAKPVVLFGVAFPSRNGAEKRLGLPKGTLSRKQSAARDQAILGAVMRYRSTPGAPHG